jgi:hypothetical protein
VNTPTVDELLREASRQVRAIMWDVTALDGPALAAAWPAFAGQVGHALAAVPLPDEATRLLIHRAAGPRPRPNRWGPPVDAEPELHLLRAGQALGAVAHLLDRYAVPPGSVAARNETVLVRRRIAECLFIGAHATALGLGEHANLLHPARAGIAFEQPGLRLAVNGATLASSRRLASELATLQAHTAHYLAGGPSPGTGRRSEQFVDPDRLPHALAGWEVTAMRVLHAAPPSVRDLAGIAHTEQALLTHTMVLLNAAARAGVLDPADFASQIRPRLENAQTGWGEVAASWPAQMTTPAPPSLAGVAASAQLHQVLDEITRDGNVWASPALIAQREHLVDVAGLLRDAVAASSARAERFAELPAELAAAGHLRAPARLLAATERHPNGRGSEPESAVRTTDVANRRIVIVGPEQMAGARTAACDLWLRLRSLTQSLETLPLGRAGRAVVEPASIAKAAARGAPREALGSIHLARHGSVRR